MRNRARRPRDGGGGRSFLAQYRHAGEKRRIPLGSCSAVSLANGRNAARAIMGDVAKGHDPASDRKRKAAHDALTLDALIEQWETLGLAGKRERYVAEAVRAVRYAFADHLKKPAADLNRSERRSHLDNLASAGKNAMASRTTAYGRALLPMGGQARIAVYKPIPGPPACACGQAGARAHR